jgi:hypothetical protein
MPSEKKKNSTKEGGRRKKRLSEIAEEKKEKKRVDKEKVRRANIIEDRRRKAAIEKALSERTPAQKRQDREEEDDGNRSVIRPRVETLYNRRVGGRNIPSLDTIFEQDITDFNPARLQAAVAEMRNNVENASPQEIKEMQDQVSEILTEVTVDIANKTKERFEKESKIRKELLLQLVDSFIRDETANATKDKDYLVDGALRDVAFQNEYKDVAEMMKAMGYKDLTKLRKKIRTSVAETRQKYFNDKTNSTLMEAVMTFNEELDKKEMEAEQEEIASMKVDQAIEEYPRRKKEFEEFKQKEQEDMNNMQDVVPTNDMDIEPQPDVGNMGLMEAEAMKFSDDLKEAEVKRWYKNVRETSIFRRFVNKENKEMDNMGDINTENEMPIDYDALYNTDYERIMNILKDIDNILPVIRPSQLMDFLLDLNDAMKGKVSDPDKFKEKYALMYQSMMYIWKKAQELHPTYFTTYTESPGELIERVKSVKKEMEKIGEVRTVEDLDADTIKYLENLENIYTAELPKAQAAEAQLLNFGMNDMLPDYAKHMEGVEGFINPGPIEELTEKQYRDSVAKLKQISNKLNSMMENGNIDFKKFEALKTEWQAINNRYIVKNFKHIRNKANEVEHKKIEDFRTKAEPEIREGLVDLSKLMFQDYKAGHDYFLIDDFSSLFKEYYAVREEIDDPKMLHEAFLTHDYDWLNDYMKRIKTLEDKIMLKRHPTRDHQTILNDLNKRRDMLDQVVKKFKNASEEGGIAYEVSSREKAMIQNFEQNSREITAEFSAKEVYNVMYKDFPENWTDAVHKLEAEVLELRTAVKDDISCFGPFLNDVVNRIFDRFRQKIQEVGSDERMKYDSAIESEKKMVQKIITKEAYHRTGAKLMNAAKSSTLQKFVLDPSSFNALDQQKMLDHTPAGMYLSDTRRLLDIVRQSMELRKKMMSQVFRQLNMEGNANSIKFDVVATNLFPPSEVEFKLRYLMSLAPDARKKYMDGRFIQAIKMVDDNFEFSDITNENLIEKINSIAQQSKSFLQTVVGPTPVAWGDFENMANELTRSKYAILSQVRDKPVEDDQDQIDRDKPGPSDEFQYDQDAGAQPNDNGFNENVTFNPTTQGQIIRDKIDDAKRQNYMRMVGSMASTSLEPSDDEPYVPMHTSSAKFYFDGGNYKNIKSQYQSMRPLIPKKPVDDPNGFIEETLAYYGPVLGIKGRKSSQKDHPAFLQKEAIELQELVGAYTNYTSVTAGNYVHDASAQPQASAPAPDQQPQDQQPQNTKPNNDNNVDPTSTGEDQSDPLTSGLRSAFNNSADVEATFDPFPKPNW